MRRVHRGPKNSQAQRQSSLQAPSHNRDSSFTTVQAMSG